MLIFIFKYIVLKWNIVLGPVMAPNNQKMILRICELLYIITMIWYKERNWKVLLSHPHHFFYTTIILVLIYKYLKKIIQWERIELELFFSPFNLTQIENTFRVIDSGNIGHMILAIFSASKGQNYILPKYLVGKKTPTYWS